MVDVADPDLQNLLLSRNEVVFLLSPELRFLECSPAWDSFAAGNGGRGISRSEVAGKSILTFVPEVLRKFYEHKYWLVQHQHSPVDFDYHCSSAEKIRLFRMVLRPMKDFILVINRLTLEEECEVRSPLLPEEKRNYLSASNFLTMCAFCRKARRNDQQWDWVPEFLNEPELRTTHGLCPRCISVLYGDLSLPVGPG